MNPFLSRPDTVYRQSYLEALREFHAELHNLEQDTVALTHNFEGYVRHLQRQASDEQRDGFVPETFYWLIDDNIYIGRLSLRHHLNDRLLQFGGHIGYEIRPTKRRMGYGKTILRLGLAQARRQGITRALVTCDDDN
ncbi:MAG: GNAT family N-acetyltransferase, partial [Chloroflexota bacterium]